MPEPPTAKLGAAMTPKRFRTGNRRSSPAQDRASFYCDECGRGPSTSIDGTWRHRCASTSGLGKDCRVARGTHLPLAVHWVLGGELREAGC
eukprot:264709-Pyramimonas_sp.AAC.1